MIGLLSHLLAPEDRRPSLATLEEGLIGAIEPVEAKVIGGAPASAAAAAASPGAAAAAAAAPGAAASPSAR